MPSGGPMHGRLALELFGCGQTALYVVAAGQRQCDPCNSNGNATGSARCPTWVLLRCALIKPPEGNSTPGSLKAVLVSLVKPVAYLKNRVKVSKSPSLGVKSYNKSKPWSAQHVASS